MTSEAINKMIEKIIPKYTVMDEWGYTDEIVVSKVNEIIDVINKLDSKHNEGETMLSGKTIVTTDTSLEAIKRNAIENYKQLFLEAFEKEIGCTDECAKKFYEGLGCKACYWNRIKQIVEEVKYE